MEFRVVPIAEEHIEGFRAALDSVARERRYLAFLEAPSLEDCAAFVRDNIRRGHPQFIALVEGHIVGWCDVMPLPRPVNAHCGVLRIGIVSGFRRRGIGAALMRVTLDTARNAGFTRIELTVRENNRSAIVLYEKLGFTIEGLKRNAVRVEDKYENYVCMGLLFDDAV